MHGLPPEEGPRSARPLSPTDRARAALHGRKMLLQPGSVDRVAEASQYSGLWIPFADLRPNAHPNRNVCPSGAAISPLLTVKEAPRRSQNSSLRLHAFS